MADIDLVRKQWTSSSSFLSAFFILLCTLRGKRICIMEKGFGPLCLVCVSVCVCLWNTKYRCLWILLRICIMREKVLGTFMF